MAGSKPTASYLPIHILLVEDNPGDVVLTQEALSDAHLANTLTVMHTGSEALAFLRRQAPFQQAETVDLVILDLNLPGQDGRQVLMILKADPDLKKIPVIILTGSKEKTDVMNAYSLAECYLTKPITAQHILEFVMSLNLFQLLIVVPDPPKAG